MAHLPQVEKQRSHVVQLKFGIHPMETTGSGDEGWTQGKVCSRMQVNPGKHQADVSSSFGGAGWEILMGESG